MTTEPNGDYPSDLSEDGKALYLGMEILAHNQANLHATMDSLYQGERKRRLALEVLIDHVLDEAAHIWGGTTRQYEACLDILRYRGKSGPDADPGFNGSNWIEVLSKEHPEYREES